MESLLYLFSKVDIFLLCKTYSIPYLLDPSNESTNYMRPRLRKSRKILEEEGLTAKRLSVTASRLARARRALEEISSLAFSDIAVEISSIRIVLDLNLLRSWPEEVGLRVLRKSIEALCPPGDYGVRLEKLEALFADLMASPAFRKRTLGGTIIARDDKAKQVILVPENPSGAKAETHVFVE